MANELVLVPQDIPQHAISVDQAGVANADALAGISTGFPPSIRIKANKFRIVDGNGQETVLKAAELAQNEFLDVVVLAAKPGLSKVFYATAFDPNQTEATSPDCFSLDGVKPDATVAAPPCTSCAGCPKNAFGSGTNSAGQPTKGKACSDNKIIAVFRKGSVYQLKVPPASLKNFGLYVKTLTNRGVPLGNVQTYIGFDENADYSVLTFRVGSFIPEVAKARLMELASSQEVADIVKPVGYVALPPPAPAPVEVAPVAAPVLAPEPPVEEAKPPKKKETAPTTKVMSDADIARELGL